MADFALARFRKQIPVKNATLGYELDRREACASGNWLHTWHMDIDGNQRVVRRKLADAAAATRAFREWSAALKKDGYEAVPAKSNGWTINPRGLRGYYTDGTWGSPKAWGAGIEVEVVEDGKAPKRKTVEAPAPIELDPAALAKLVKAKPPSARATVAQIIEATNAWFAQVVAAGLPVDDIPDADRAAIITSGPYSDKELRAGERALNMKLPASYVEQLRTFGEVAVLGRYGREAAHPLAKRKDWPLASTLAEATGTLGWEIERHGEPGSFTPKQIAGRQWIRFGGNAPGGSDHNFIMDLGKVRKGEPAIYRVDDIGLPTEITREATVYGPRAWLLAQVHALHALVAKLTPPDPKPASRPARPKRRAP